MLQTHLAQALINNPDLLILDEPTSGLDPLGRMKVRSIIQRLKNEGKTVFFSSHQIAEVDQIADRISIIDRGRALQDCGRDPADRVLPSVKVAREVDLGEQLRVERRHVDVVQGRRAVARGHPADHTG